MFKRVQWAMVALVTVMISGCSGVGSDCESGNAISYLGIDYCEVTSPYTQQVWLDRNLGASQVCTAYDDTACYGDYYQWGRDADGHEKSDSPVTNVQASNVDNVGHGDFIEAAYTYNYDWAQAADTDGSQRVANWSKTDGSFICPVGYRVPTIEELKAETLDNGVTDRDTAFSNFLKLPSAGLRYKYSGELNYQGVAGSIWSLSVADTNTSSLGFTPNGAMIYPHEGRASGFSVRCLKSSHE